MENAENLERIRTWLLDQIDKTFPEENKDESKQQILAMSEEELVNFLKQNGLIKEQEEEISEQKCVFCSIASGEIPSTLIDNSEKAIAILDINPVSEGHILVIPKEHITTQDLIPEEAKTLAKNIAEKLQKVFAPEKVEIINSEAMGHHMINVFPVYESESLTSQRKRKTLQELNEIKSKIDSYKEEQKKIVEINKEEPETQTFNEKNFWLPKRRP